MRRAFAGEMIAKRVKGGRVALRVALREPEAALLAGLHLGELVFAVQFRLPLLRMHDLQKVALARPRRHTAHGLRRAADLTAEEIADHKDDAEALPAGPELLKAAPQVRHRIKLQPQHRLDDLFDVSLAAQRRQLLTHAAVHRVNTHALLRAEREVGQRHGEAQRLPPLLGKRLRHRRAGIDEQVQVQLLRFLVKTHKELVEPRVEPPVDRAVILPRRVVPVVFEFARETRRRRRLGTAPHQLTPFPQPQRQHAQPIEEGGVKKVFRRVRGHLWPCSMLNVRCSMWNVKRSLCPRPSKTSSTPPSRAAASSPAVGCARSVTRKPAPSSKSPTAPASRACKSSSMPRCRPPICSRASSPALPSKSWAI